MNPRTRLVQWADAADAAGVALADGPLVILADARCLAFPAHLFTAAELARAERFSFAVNRAEYLGARGIIRSFLAPHVGLPPEAIGFAAPGGGKPRLIDRECAGIDVSLSHSGGRVACGFLRRGRVGVDVEAVERRGDTTAVARRALSPAELEALAEVGGDAAQRLFLRAWTRKEAVLKAAGVGLTVATAGFDVVRRSAGGVEDVSPVVLAGQPWTCESVWSQPDLELAVAYAAD